MFQDRRQNGCSVSRRRTLAAPFLLEGQAGCRALEEEHSELPLTTSLDVYVRWQMIRGIEPEPQPRQPKRIDVSQQFLFEMSPRLQSSADRTFIQSITSVTCPGSGRALTQPLPA